jgi:hypothetical protein
MFTRFNAIFSYFSSSLMRNNINSDSFGPFQYLLVSDMIFLFDERPDA